MPFFKVDRISAVLREEDVEGLVAIHGAPDDEYESEAERIEICAIVRDVWAEMFELDERDLVKRESAFRRVSEKLTQ